MRIPFLTFERGLLVLAVVAATASQSEIGDLRRTQDAAVRARDEALLLAKEANDNANDAIHVAKTFRSAAERWERLYQDMKSETCGQGSPI